MHLFYIFDMHLEWNMLLLICNNNEKNWNPSAVKLISHIWINVYCASCVVHSEELTVFTVQTHIYM